jgi:hypothetical protein
MPQLLKQFFRQLPPFIFIGVMIALVAAIFILFSYVFLWGLVIGGILWGIHALKQYFQPQATSKPTQSAQSKGRIIDHDQQK